MQNVDQQEELMGIMKRLDLKFKLLYTKAEAARVLGLSIPTLDRMKANGVGMECKKITTGSGKNGRVMYPFSEIARFYFDTWKTE